MMQREKLCVTDENREKITSIYCNRLLDDMDFSTLYCFAYDMLVDNKKGLTNKMLEEQIVDYYPDILEE
jgi:cell division protein YceG involved in septum cleavage